MFIHRTPDPSSLAYQQEIFPPSAQQLITFGSAYAEARHVALGRLNLANQHEIFF